MPIPSSGPHQTTSSFQSASIPCQLMLEWQSRNQEVFRVFCPTVQIHNHFPTCRVSENKIESNQILTAFSFHQQRLENLKILHYPKLIVFKYIFKIKAYNYYVL